MSFQVGIQNWKDFCLKINIPKENYWTLRIGVLGIICDLKIDDIKNVNNKKYELIFNKKNDKDSDDFGIENWLWKSK